MPNYIVDSEGSLFEEGDTNAKFAKNSGGRVVYREGSEVDEATLESIRPGLARELRAKLREGRAEEKDAAKAEESETKEVTANEVQDKEGARPRRGG